MIVEWDIEGADCPLAQCGIKTRRTEIPDNEIPDDPAARDQFIDEWVEEEFRREVCAVWRIAE
jgi:hypothetical protein